MAPCGKCSRTGAFQQPSWEEGFQMLLSKASRPACECCWHYGNGLSERAHTLLQTWHHVSMPVHDPAAQKLGTHV